MEQARDGVYSPAGLYDPKVVEYANGLTLVAKSRPGVPTVSVRVNVELGMAHYECGRQHVPHFLEHMLFGSIPGISEAELERRFFEMGASSNAWTGTFDTVYQLDVFSGKAIEGLNLFADMLHGAELSESEFQNTKDIIWREMGGEPGPVQLQSLPGGKLASALRKVGADLSPRHFRACEAWDAGQDVTFDSVEKAYERFYSPQRTTWIVVGDFEMDALLDWAGNRFGALQRGEADPPRKPRVGEFTRKEYTGFDWEPGIAMVSRTNGLTGDDYYARVFLSHLLDETLYKRLRLDTALTYTPYSTNWNWEDWGLFGLEAEVEEENQDEALRIIREITSELVNEPLPEDEFRTIQLSLLREWAQTTETSAGFAGHYVNSLFELRRHGAFVNDEVALAKLTPDEVHEVAKRLFSPSNTVILRDGDRQARIDARREEEP